MKDTVDEVSVTRAEAAEICGITDAQFKQWLDRTYIFAEKKEGRGYHLAFKTADLFKLKAMASLIGMGVSVSEAAKAVQPFSPYGDFLHNRGGFFQLTQNPDGRWVPAWGPEKIISIWIDTIAIADAIWPKLREAIRSRFDAGKADRIIGHFEKELRRRAEWRNEIVLAGTTPVPRD